MTFVTEEISAADQRRVGFPRLIDSHGQPIEPYRWTVDRQSDSYLIASNHRDPDRPSETRFVFGWKGHQFRLNAVSETSGEVSTGLRWNWGLSSSTAEMLGTLGNCEEAISALKAALIAYSGRIHPVQYVHFEF
jgi:hypothetical protein